VLETTSPRVLLDRKDSLMAAMPAVATADGVDQVLLFIVDILNEEATLLVPNDLVKTLAEKSFGATVTGDTVVLGRNPAAPRRAPQAQLVAVDDVTRTVSKTHALLTLTASGWVVTDLDSTNGVALGAVADAGTEVDGSAPLSGPFFLGDAALELRADG
jgi:inorganic pyrophosphatase/exopolyphosphatase